MKFSATFSIGDAWIGVRHSSSLVSAAFKDEMDTQHTVTVCLVPFVVFLVSWRRPWGYDPMDYLRYDPLAVEDGACCPGIRRREPTGCCSLGRGGERYDPIDDCGRHPHKPH